MSRQSTVTLVETDDAALHLHPMSDLHIEHHRKWSARRICLSHVLALPGWPRIDAAGLSSMPAEMCIEAYFKDGPDQHTEAADHLSRVAMRLREYKAVSTDPTTGERIERTRHTHGLRYVDCAVTPWIREVLTLHGTAIDCRPALQALAGGLEKATSWPALGALLLTDDESMVARVAYSVIAPDKHLIRGDASPYVDGNNGPVLLGAAAVATRRLRMEDMLPPSRTTWLERRSEQLIARGKCPLDDGLSVLVNHSLELAIKQRGLTDSLDAAKARYREAAQHALVDIDSEDIDSLDDMGATMDQLLKRIDGALPKDGKEGPALN